VSACQVHATRRKDDCSAVLRAQLLCHADAGTGFFEIDVYERHVRALAARQFQRLARRMRRS
jgi:hypothetical protein